VIICGMDKINYDDGVYVLLSDLGTEGITVVGQYHTPEEAIQGMDDMWTNLVLVKIFEFELTVNSAVQEQNS